MPGPHTGSAAEYLGYEEYTPTGYTVGAKPIKRSATDVQEWVVQDTGGVQIILKFDKNFVKKHLFTFSKKTADVQHAADLLFTTAGSPKGKEPEYLLAAQMAALNAKLLKTLLYRAEEKTCRHCKDPSTGQSRFRSAHLCGRADCNHAVSTHTDDSGKCNAPGCACTGVGADVYCPDGVTGAVILRDAYNVSNPAPVAPVKPDFSKVADKKQAGLDHSLATKKYSDDMAKRAKAPELSGVKTALSTAKTVDTSRTYAAKRAASGKGDDPLAGAATAVNTAVVLSLIPKADFESVVVGAIQAAMAGWADGAEKHIRWDFGAKHKGCVVQVDLTKKPTDWGKIQGVEVLVTKSPLSTAKKLMFVVGHLSAGF